MTIKLGYSPFVTLKLVGHFSARKMADKILQVGFYWPTLFMDCFDF